MEKISIILLVVALTLGRTVRGELIETNEMQSVLSTVVPYFTGTNMTPQELISNLTDTLQRMDPPRRLPVVISVTPELFKNQSSVTFSASNIRVDKILDIMSSLMYTKFLIMHGSVVLKEIECWDWTTYRQDISGDALRDLGLTTESDENDVKEALQHFGIRFTSGCSVTIMSKETKNKMLNVQLTLKPDDANKVQGIIQLLKEGFKIDKKEPQQASTP